ncbi:MAG: hypothetical protein JST44_21560, partial [Cyanobacteria bacterium SZAS LIN-5]|nr:hypothetical protein [Cyanobacteria bacterium SZAS LIN-5]
MKSTAISGTGRFDLAPASRAAGAAMVELQRTLRGLWMTSTTHRKVFSLAAACALFGETVQSGCACSASSTTGDASLGFALGDKAARLA